MPFQPRVDIIACRLRSVDEDCTEDARSYAEGEHSGYFVVVANCFIVIARMTLNLVTWIAGSFASFLTSTFIQLVAVRMIDWVAPHFMERYLLYRWCVSALAV